MKAPKQIYTPAPDPQATAAAQTAMNKETAIANTGLNAINQYTPDGSLTYGQSGTWADGTPRFYATQTLSPENQKLYEQGKQADLQMNDIGLRQIGKVGGILDTPFNIDAATGNKLADMQAQRLDPVWASKEKQLEQSLMDRGIRPGSEAYAAMHDQYARDRNDAYNSMYLAARGQAANEATLERNQPLNEITALLNGQQIQNPNFVNTPNSNIANTDYAGMVYDSAKINQANTQAYNQNKQANYQAGLGGLFGLGSSLLGGIGRIGASKF